MFLPKKSRIFEDLVKQALIVKKSAQLFQKIVFNLRNLKKDSLAFEKLEDQADKMVHKITDEIEKRFILPLDKEDIKELTESLDDIVDNLEQVTNRLKIYRITKSNPALKEFSQLILQATELIHQGMVMVKDYEMDSKDFASCYKKLHDLEDEGDKLHRQSLENLMGERTSMFDGKGFMSIMKWKEIIHTLEDTLDICEADAILLERLRIKYK